MFRYIIRRVLYMVPTVFGVILITFYLFNVAGGDPALIRLGKHADPESMEIYDLRRGLNKPLIFGLWGRTRAYERTDFDGNAGSWSRVDGVEYAGAHGGFIRMDGEGEYIAPAYFRLAPDQMYRWEMRCRAPAGTEALFIVTDGERELVSVKVPESGRFEVVRVPFATGASTEFLECKFRIISGSVELDAIKLGKRVKNVFDSQLVFYIGQILRFDFGVSDETNQRISTMILSGILPSLALTVPMFFVGLISAVIVALVCAFLRNTFIDRFFVVFSVVLMSVNYLVWIILGQYIFAYRLHLFPIWGFETMRYLILPALIGVISGMGADVRFYRTIMLDEMYRDYVRTAFAKGAGKPRVLFKHVLKNAMIPILTSVVMAIPFLYTGSLLLESFFGIPGLGNISINAINSADFDVIRAVVFVGAMIYVVANLMTDICYSLVDPRVKLK